MEVPKVRGLLRDDLSLCTILRPYRSIYNVQQKNVNYLHFIDDLNDVVNECEHLIGDLYDIQRKTASQLLTFAITDTDKEYNKKFPNHIPIAYAMVGNSLSMDKFRNMLDQVTDLCKDKGVKILCQCCDGQFRSIVCKTRENDPPTWIAWQKDIWNKTMKKMKMEILKFLMKCY